MSAEDVFTRLVSKAINRLGFRLLPIWEMKVSAQNADGTLELKSLDPRIAGQSNVPLFGIGPGSSIKVPAGSLVLLIHRNMDERKFLALPTWSGIKSTQMIIVCDDLQLGGIATNPAVLGDAQKTAMTTLLTALGVFATAIGVAVPALAGAATTLNTAITTFGTANYLSMKVKIAP